MPRLDPKVINLACFLYHSREDAEEGVNFGGTAFLVSVPSAVPSQQYICAVTNWHVAVRDGASVLRLNTKSGGTDIIEAGPEDWSFDPRYDIAVLPVSFPNNEKHLKAQIPTSAFITRETLERRRFGPGEDVFMVGRFVDHDGGANRNMPTVRFGNISAMPTPIQQPNGRSADAFILDMHSRDGYSGSPVFVYRAPGYDLTEGVDPKDPAFLMAGTNFLGFLGIHFGQFPERWKIVGTTIEAVRENTAANLSLDGNAAVSGLSGMTCVLPAWCIQEVLDMPDLKNRRDANDEEILKKLAAKGQSVPDAEVAARRDAGLAKALSTPPTPFSPPKSGEAE